MRRVTTVIVGGGHCGLAMSHCLSQHDVDHVVLERGEVGQAWRTERWDSLTLLTPNWMSHLPGEGSPGGNPDGFMTKADLVARLDLYALGKPVETRTAVEGISGSEGAFTVHTDRGPIACANVVLATGACRKPRVPKAAKHLPRTVQSFDPVRYKQPAELPAGRVLVVGASATGLQLAKEIHVSGRPVTLAIGEHVRVPRRYRGRDIKWWMDQLGLLALRYDEVDDLNRVRRSPSLQLTGSAERADLDLNVLSDLGVELVGRFAGLRDGKAVFSGGLANHCASADLKLTRLLDGIDAWIIEHRIEVEEPAPRRPQATRVPASPRLEIDLGDGAFGSVVWATGYAPDWSWLDLPVFDPRGRLRHDGGVIAPGLYAMGLPFMRRRNSTLIHGAGADAADLAAHMLGRCTRQAA